MLSYMLNNVHNQLYKEPDVKCVQIRADILTGGNPVRLRLNQSVIASLGWVLGNNAC